MRKIKPNNYNSIERYSICQIAHYLLAILMHASHTLSPSFTCPCKLCAERARNVRSTYSNHWIYSRLKCFKRAIGTCMCLYVCKMLFIFFYAWNTKFYQKNNNNTRLDNEWIDAFSMRHCRRFLASLLFRFLCHKLLLTATIIGLSVSRDKQK